jgi:hypothetical protein
MSEPSKTLSTESSLPTATKPPPQELTTTAPHNNDVLCGRGGIINSHPGNEQYRKFVDRKKRLYLTARFKREKRLISIQIVYQVRNLNPPGRFLMKDPANPSTWHEIGDEKAREKTSQILREMASTVKRQLEEDFRKAQQGPPPPPPKLSAAPTVWRSHPYSSAGPMGGWRSQPPIQHQQQQTQQQQQSQPPPLPQQQPALQLILEQVSKLEEDIRKRTLVTESILKQWKTQQARNAALAGVATKVPLPPPVCQLIHQQTRQQQQQPPPPYWAYQQLYNPNNYCPPPLCGGISNCMIPTVHNPQNHHSTHTDTSHKPNT